MDTIKWLSLALAAAGITGLWLVAEMTEPVEMQIGDIRDSDVGRIVRVEGFVQDFSERSGNLFFTLADSGGSIKVVFFEKDAAHERINATYIREGRDYSVTGRVARYGGGLEIIADNIEKES